MLELVAAQLGRKPEISFEVAVECIFGWPAVLKNIPIKPTGEPNPNLYYLSCPWLRRRLARLEDAGVIDELQRLAAADRQLEADLIRAQAEHASEMRTALAANSAPEQPRAPGRCLIAGAREPLLMKCLHAHLAYYLVHNDYLLGGILAQRIDQLWCGDEHCAAMMTSIREIVGRGEEGGR